MELDQPVTYSEYWAEVASLAKTITQEARAEGQEPLDRLNETIDGHQWVINTAFNFDVLRHCWSHDSIFESGTATELNEDGMFWARAAYCAMHQDVVGHSNFCAEEEEEGVTCTHCGGPNARMGDPNAEVYDPCVGEPICESCRNRLELDPDES